MVRLARGAPGILVEHEQLDAQPYLLNCLNGTVDLRNGTLQAHDPGDLLTLQCPVAYDPDAQAPLWEACIERWQPDLTVRDYVQLRAGAGATGHPTETVDVDYGSGGNGKSKFWGAIQHVLGPYTVVPHKSLLVAQRHEQHATVVANLFRKRLAVASETKAADVLDDEQVKNLTGGDRLSGRRMREDPWEFQPTHTLVMFSNHKPSVRGRDEGIWRRLRLVPWEVTIPEDERDPNLSAKLAAEASPGSSRAPAGSSPRA
jgi:putative DNA primase/helicase